MPGKYSISDVSIIEGIAPSSIIKNVKLEASNHSISTISKCTERTTDLRTLELMGNNVLNECYIDLTLEKLRELDSNVEAQNQYILSRSKFLDRGMVNVLIIKLQIGPGQKLTENDYDYLQNLLMWPRNDIYVMPIIEYADASVRTQRPIMYEEFVKKMLSQKQNWSNYCNIAMSIPVYYPRGRIENLFEIYNDEKPTFIAVDFNNSRMDKPSNIVGTLINHFNKENEEKTFFYGVNVKPYKKGPENTSAWDIYLAHGSFNAIGPMHTRPHAVIAPAEWNKMGRIFNKEDVTYTVVDDEQRDRFIEWVDSTYEITLDKEYSKNGLSLYSYLKRYNLQNTNAVLSDISVATRKNDTDFIKDMIEKIPVEVRNKNLLSAEKRKRRMQPLF